MKRFLYSASLALGLLLGTFGVASAVSIFNVQQGGSGAGTFTAGLLGASGTNIFYSNPTTTATCAGTNSCTSFTILGSSPITITGSAGSGITDIGTGYATSTGPTVTLSTTTQSFNGLTIAQTITRPNTTDLLFTPLISGTLNVAGGGTGDQTFTAGQLLYGNGTNALTSVATNTASCSSGVSCTSFAVIASGAISITNSGVTQVTAGNGISVSGATGNVTISQTSNVATSTGETAGQLAYWTSTNATPATLGKLATSTLQGSGVISVTAGATTLGGSPITVSCSTCGTGSVTSVTLATPNSTLTVGGTNPVTTSGTINADLNLAHSNWWTAIQNFTNASSSQFTATSTLNIPNSGTVPTLSTGAIYVNTNSIASSSIAFGTAANHNLFSTHSFSGVLASSTLAYMGLFSATGSTTLNIANPIHSTTLNSFFCKTDIGTAYLAFGNGAATTTRVQCTTSGASGTSLSNNTWVGRQNVYLEAGTSASAPNYITFTADVEDTN